MAARESMGKDVDQGVIQRVVTGLKFAITGVGPMNFFGPAQPIAPQAQDLVEGRFFDFPVGYNLRQTPRSGEAIGFHDLRNIADGYDLLRLVIETRKDQIKSYDWEIVPVDPKQAVEDVQSDVTTAMNFLQMPDQEHSWDDWISMFVEDLLVLDAVCVYPRMNKGGSLYGLELVDAATIKRLLDEQGRTPLPPSPAYQQVIKGIAAADYSRDTLLYMARNMRTNKVYGYSPVEQVLMTVNIALRRQMTQLSFYTEGTVPEAIAQAPEDYTPKQLKELQDWWDSKMEAGAMKRRVSFIPNLKDIVFPRAEVLKDEYDEWLARIICFAFSIPPTAFIKQSNRATAEQADESAKEEGLKPLLRWLENKITLMVQRYLKLPNVKFSWKTEAAVDPLVQAQIDDLYVAMQAKSPDEVRESLGMDAMTPEERTAAFPPAPTPGFDENGAPIAPAIPKVPNGKPGTGQPKVPNGQPKPPKPAQKMLADAIALLDPLRVAETMAKFAAATPASVIEHKPNITVEIGDTNVRTFTPRDGTEAANWRLGKRLVGGRLPNGKMFAEWIDKEQV